MATKCLHIPYSTWKAIVNTNSFKSYHHVEVVDSVVIVWCGNTDVQYYAEVDADDYTDWYTNFYTDSTVVVSHDDAIAQIIGLTIKPPTPKEPDGRINIVNAPMSHGMSTWWTGRGDDMNPTPPASGRGQGAEMNFDFTGASDETVTLDFNSYVEIYDGEGVWSPVANWSIHDRFWVSCYIPKNEDLCIVNAQNEGNCNVVDTGQGFSIIVPAPGGDGAYDIDLTKARPAPAGDGSQINYWQVGAYMNENDPTPAFDASYGPAGDHALFYDLAFSIPFCNDMPMGSPIGRFEVDSDKTEPLNKNWQVKVRCKRVSTGVGEFAVWLKFFRPNTIEYVFGT